MKSAILLCSMAAGVFLHAAENATLSGRVLDPSGAAVGGAHLKLVKGASSVTLDAGAGGRFHWENLPPGSYELTVTSAGFTPLRQKVELPPGANTLVDLMLQIPIVSEHVVITAKAPPDEGSFETRPENSREVLEIREVRESAAKDVGEALAALDGLWRIRKGGIANDVVLRGFQQGNVNVLIDDVRINGACPNHMDPAAFHVDFAEIESVQVTKGPFDIRNQGSLAGTVNVTSKKPEGFRITPNLSTGSFGFFNPSMQASAAFGKFYALGGYSYRRSDIYSDGSGRRATDYANYTAQGRANAAFDVNTGWTKFGGSLPHNQNFEVAYTRQAGGLTLYPYLLMDANYDDADRASARWSIREPGGPVRQIQAQGYFSKVKHWMTDELRSSGAGLPRPYSMATYAGTRALGGRIEAELQNTIIGFEGYRRDWNAVNTMRMSGVYMDQASLPGVQMLVGGLYAQHRREIGKLRITAGARLDTASSEALNNGMNTALYWAYNGTRSTSSTDVNPSGTLWATYALSHRLELFAGAGTTVRLPDPQERYFALKRSGSDWVGNPLLHRTRNNEADLGVNIRASRFTLRPTLFLSRLDGFVALQSQPRVNMIAGIMNASARSYENVDARIYGGEVSWSFRFSRSLMLSGGTSYTRGVQFAKPEAGMGRVNIAEMPPLKSRAAVRYGRRLFYAEAESRAVARQDNIDASLRELPTAGYVLLGVKGGIHHSRLNLAAGVDNLTNRFYYDHLSMQRDPFRTGTRVPDPGRSVYLNLSVMLR